MCPLELAEALEIIYSSAFKYFLTIASFFYKKILGESAIHKTNIRAAALVEVREASVEFHPLDPSSEEAWGSVENQRRTIWGRIIY